jgi:type III restriction enzyme
MARYLFTGFRRGLYPEEKFQSDPERILAIVLDRDALKWFRPAKGQFQIFYRDGADHQEYQPDFVAETPDTIYMLESKRRSELGTVVVEVKKAAAIQWCRHATAHTATYDGKPWRYVLIPHDVIAENMTLEVLAGQFGVD